PDYLFDTGNCTNGNFSTTGDYTLTSTFAQYCNLKINAGDTFKIPTSTSNLDSKTVTLLIKDTLFINGIINGSPIGTHTQSSYSGGNINTAGGSGGSASRVNFNTAEGYNSVINWNNYNQSLNFNPPSYSMTFLSGSGCTTLTPPVNITPAALNEAIKIRSNLFGCEGAGSTADGYPLTPYDNGGFGGTGLYLICRVLVFNGQINLKGSNGSTSYSGWGANVYGGGGGGGSLVISAETILQNTGTVNLNGGTGFPNVSAPYCKSSPGGNGAYIIIDR
ncbi:MAG: hypothetical protein ACOVOV_18105, partial [Dolichospermum sp.]